MHGERTSTTSDGPDPGHYGVVVVGAGPAGVSAALRAAHLGASVAVVEGSRVGGTCVNTGCVPTRVLARAARLLRDVSSAGEFGVQVPRPDLAWERTAARVRSTVEQVQGAKDIEGQLKAAGVHLFTEEWARFTDPHTVELSESGRRLTGDAVVVAAGGRSRTLPIEGIELTTVAEHIVDLERLPASVVIVGSGATGAQLATVFSAFGVSVTLLELADRIMPAADHDVSAAIAAAFEADGVEIRTGVAGVARVEARDDGWRRVVLAGTGEHVDAEVVVVCAGWPARLDGLGLDAAGVVATGSTIPVDARQRSNVGHIFVAGDADDDTQLVQAGVASGFVAGTNAVLGAATGTWAEADHAVLSSGGFTDPDYGQVGLTEAQARTAHPDALAVTVPYARLERAVIDARTTGFFKLIATADARRLLGAHAVGEEALEVIQCVAAAMQAGADVRTLATTEYAYPTYTSVIGLAASELLHAGGLDELLEDVQASTSAAQVNLVDSAGGVALAR